MRYYGIFTMEKTMHPFCSFLTFNITKEQYIEIHGVATSRMVIMEI